MERTTHEMKITHVLHTTMIELDHHLFKCIQMKEITSFEEYLKRNTLETAA